MSNLLHTLNKYGIHDFVVVDVGAKGSIETIQEITSLIEVHAFEPNPYEFETLQKKYLLHSFKKLFLNNLGLSDIVGNSNFMISNKSSMSSLLQPDIENYKKHFGSYNDYKEWAWGISPQQQIDIALTTLDQYFEKSVRIDYLKIDTQGSELSILKGAEQLLKKGHINVIKVEVSTIATYQQQAYFSDIDIYLRNLNYCLVDFITYRENSTYLNNAGQEQHYAPCGDAIYCYALPFDDKKEILKTSVIINSLGYRSLAKNLLSSTSLSKIEIDQLLEQSKKHTAQVWKSIAKDIMPPFLLKLWKSIRV
jgi:FkbM family methyltransferase